MTDSVGAIPNATRGKIIAKNGTKSDAPLIPSMFTTMAKDWAMGNIHQEVVQH